MLPKVQCSWLFWMATLEHGAKNQLSWDVMSFKYGITTHIRRHSQCCNWLFTSEVTGIVVKRMRLNHLSDRGMKGGCILDSRCWKVTGIHQLEVRKTGGKGVSKVIQHPLGSSGGACCCLNSNSKREKMSDSCEQNFPKLYNIWQGFWSLVKCQTN